MLGPLMTTTPQDPAVPSIPGVRPVSAPDATPVSALSALDPDPFDVTVLVKRAADLARVLESGWYIWSPVFCFRTPYLLSPSTLLCIISIRHRDSVPRDQPTAALAPIQLASEHPI